MMGMTHNSSLPDSGITPENDDAPLEFDPVLCRRRNGWTAEKQRVFIDTLAKLGLVSEAAQAAGMSRKSAYKLRERPNAESFVQAWDIALMMGQDRVRECTVDRAVNGYMVPVFYGGIQRGEVRRYNDTLLMKAITTFGQRRPQPHAKKKKSQ